MKYIQLLLFFFCTSIIYSQAGLPDFSVKVQVVRKIKISQSLRDSYVVPVNESWEATLTDGSKWTNNGGAGWVLFSIPSNQVAVTPAINGNNNVQTVLTDHENRIDGLAAGGSDGVVTNVILNGNNIEFTGTGGGFDGVVNLTPVLNNSADGLSLDANSPYQLITFAGGTTSQLNALPAPPANTLRLKIATDAGGNLVASSGHTTVVKTSSFAYTAADQSIGGLAIRTDVNAGDLVGTVNEIVGTERQYYSGNVKNTGASLTITAGAGVTIDGAWKTGTETSITVNGKGSYKIEETEVNGTFWVICDNCVSDPNAGNLYTYNDALSQPDFNSITGWSGAGSPIVVSADNDTGGFSMQLTQAGAATFVATSRNLNVLPQATTFNFSFRIKAVAGRQNVGARFRQNNGTNTTIGQAYVNTTGAYQTVSGTFTTLLTDNPVTMQLLTSSDVNNGAYTLLVDTVNLTQQ
jgi:hypothetical protein